MWFKTEERRDEFEKELASKLNFEHDQLRAIRDELAKLPSQVLIRDWFAQRKPPIDGQEILTQLRKVLPNRAALFSWVYGPGSSISRDLLYVRLPSSEKRRLVNLILASVRPRFPWMNARHIHAMAFRPSAFDAISKKTKLPSEYPTWGPLYRRATIPKGRGKRYLWIPNPPLKRIQTAILRLVGPSLACCLRPNVFGVSTGFRGPTFQNALAHVGKKYVASFDVKDFFPSTRVSDILVGLRHASRNNPTMIDPSHCPPYLLDNPQYRRLTWTHDAEILISRIATHRGRLPQGSPLSPILANIAFAIFDERIMDGLKIEFGDRNYCYTRYFDDITISLTSTGARQRNLTTPSLVRIRFEQILTDILRESPYRLRRSKSRCSDAKTGHNITGLVVHPDHVRLNRDLRRRLRLIVHKLEDGDFVSEARTWSNGRSLPTPVFKSITNGHRWSLVGLRQKRCSAERLATLLIRNIYPDIRVRRILRDWYIWRDTLSNTADIVSGRSAFILIEWLLAALWSGSLTVKTKGDNEITFFQDSTEVCAVLAESSLDYFYLHKDQAIAVAEYWHYLKGLHGYLNSCPNRQEFDAILSRREKLREILSMIRIVADPHHPVPQPARPPTEPITNSELIKRQANKVINEYNEYTRRIGVKPDGQMGSLQAVFCEIVKDHEGFERWIKTCSEILVRRLTLLPPNSPVRKIIKRDLLFSYFRQKEEVMMGRIDRNYKAIAQLEEQLNLQKHSTDYVFTRAQERILFSLDAYFSAATNTRRESPDWNEQLEENPWFGKIEDRLTSAIEEFGHQRESLRSTTDEMRLFDEHSGKELISNRDLLCLADKEMNSDRVWDHLLMVATTLYILTREALEPDLCRITPPDDGTVISKPDWKRKQIWKNLVKSQDDSIQKMLTLMEKLRNRGSHGETPERRREWVGIQNYVRDILGREWSSKTGKKYPKYHAPDDLELYAYEGIVVKYVIIREVNKWLMKMAELKPWLTNI